MSLGKKLLILFIGVGVMLFGPVGAASAYTLGAINLNGACANLANRYAYQDAVGKETRLASWGSSSSNHACWKLYTAGGQTMTATVKITNKNLKTGYVSTTTRAFKGYRSLSQYLNTCNRRVKVETWANAGVGQEYLVVMLPVNC
jgi:hypothetical protein